MTKFSLTRAAMEFGVSRDTLTARLREAGYEMGREQKWTIRQCHDALRGSGDRDAVKYRREAAEAELAELEVAKARRDSISVAEVVDLIARILQPFRTRLLALPPTLGHAANPTDPVHGMAAVGAAIDSLLPLLREDVLRAFAAGPLEDAAGDKEEIE